MLTLYFSPGSSSMAPHIALNEIGAPFELKLISLANKANRAPEYLAINPEGKVPTLLIDGRPLTEVAGILFYLARRFPEAKLFPHGDLEAEAQVLSWMSFVASTIHPALGATMRTPGQEAIDNARSKFALADRRLGNREWAVGSYSIADIHLFRLYWRMAGRLKPAPGEFPNLARHHDRMMARVAVRKTLEAEAAFA